MMADDMDIPMPSMMPAGATWRNARQRQGLDGATRRLVLFAGVIGGGLLLLVGAWSLTGHRSADVPVIEPDSRALRTKPENRGGLQLTGQDDAIMSGGGGGQDAMAPPPETPAPQALRDAAALPAAPPAVPSASGAKAAPTPEPAPTPAAQVAPTAKAPATAMTVQPAAKPSVTNGIVKVQLAALPTEEGARAEWQRLLHRMPQLLGGREPAVSRLDRADGKVFWRLRTGGFTDIADATAFCSKVRAQGFGCTLS